jgi:hypothetical protein
LNRKIKSSLLIFIGYLLSPFSFWNDAFINLPIAYFFGFLFSLINKKFFFLATIIFYWLTNLLGLLLLFKGSLNFFSQKEIKKQWFISLIFSTFYTAIIIAIKVFLKFPKN